MKAIAIETSGRVGSVAVVVDGVAIQEKEFAHGLKHAAGILPLIDELCRTRSWGPGDLDEIYISVGPGSFTGLRIGITFAKTAALATGLRLVAVPTVRVLADNAPPEARNVIIVLDAKRSQIFTSLLVREGDYWIESTPAHLDSLSGMLEHAPSPVYLLGEGLPWHRRFLPADLDAKGIIITPENAWRARATTVAKLGVEMARRGEYTDPLLLTPMYIRRPEAEEKLYGVSGVDSGS